jgi:predicted nucleic acid-binding Zn ribbon protein
MSFTCDFKCPKCRIVSPDVSTSVKDQWCPFCGVPMNRIYTVPTVIFNGTGFTPKFYGGKKEN